MVATQQVWEKDDMWAIHQGWSDSDLTCRKWWLQPMPKAAMTHYSNNISSPRSATSNIGACKLTPIMQFCILHNRQEYHRCKSDQGHLPCCPLKKTLGSSNTCSWKSLNSGSRMGLPNASTQWTNKYNAANNCYI
jgi:hypothetical protein